MQILWTDRHSKIFLKSTGRDLDEIELWTSLRPSLRLFGPAIRVKCLSLPAIIFSTTPTVPTAVHRFEESIAGRVYLIEVSPVSTDRWRAQIVRLPGVPTAMMPFYGPTPDEAARQLTRWLTRAHEHARPPGTV